MQLPLRTQSRNPIRQTRLRLMLSYIGVTAAILVLFAVGFYIYVRGTLVERVDDTLDHVVELVQRSLVVEARGGRFRVDVDRAFAGGDDDPTVEMDLIYLEWFASDGTPLKSTAVFREPVPLTRGYLHKTVELAPGHKLRQVTVPVRREGNLLGYLRVSHQWFEVDKPSQQLFIDLLGGGLVMLVLLGSAGWFLSELALRPVRQAYDQLRQFTADASHELRTPLAAIQTNVQVALADPAPTPEDYHRRLEVLERLTRRMGGLVADLLFLARNEGMATEEGQISCNLSEVLQQVVEEQNTRARAAGLKVQLKPTAAAMVQGDPEQLSRLFTNLIDNAIRYTADGGSVQITLGRENRDVVVEVRDTGIGMQLEHLSRIFERFYRVDQARARGQGGTGLGLAIAKTIVDNHKGEIQVESRPNEGTTFRVKLPGRPPGERRAAPDAGTTPLPLRG